MDNPSSFDLNRSIQHWRENLGQSPAFRSENLNELESHLRDSVAALETRGLSEGEAFLIATRRLGRADALGQEFGKLNAAVVWRSRALWMLAGMLFLTVGWDLSRMTAAAVTYLGSMTVTNGILLGWFSATTKLLTLGLITTLFWLLTTGKLSRWNSSSARLRQRPVGTAIILLGGMLLLKLVTGSFEVLSIRNLGPQALGQTYAVTMWFNVVSPVLALVVMVTLFSRLLSARTKTTAGQRAAAWIFVPLISMSLLLSSAQAQTNSQRPGSTGPGATDNKDNATLDQAMTLWRASKKDEAVAKFGAVDFSRRPLFPTGSVLNYSEAQFIALPQAARDKLSEQMLEDISVLKGICALVRDTGRNALAQGDTDKSGKYTAQLKQCGDALNQPDSLALLKLVGKAIQKMAAQPAPALKN